MSTYAAVNALHYHANMAVNCFDEKEPRWCDIYVIANYSDYLLGEGYRSNAQLREALRCLVKTGEVEKRKLPGETTEWRIPPSKFKRYEE